MIPEDISRETAAPIGLFTAADVVEILQERGWLSGGPSLEQMDWCERASALLGHHCADRGALADLLHLVFHYDAAELLTRVDTHAVMSRRAARKVIRKLALLLLDAVPLTSERFQEVVISLKNDLEMRGRDLFHPIRLALAGRAGEGDLDRVILLLDSAVMLSFAVPVKTARERILEFCTALD